MLLKIDQGDFLNQIWKSTPLVHEYIANISQH